MNYFNIDLCKKLSERGLVSESGWYNAYYTPVGDHEVLRYKIGQFEKSYANWGADPIPSIPAFIFQDLLTKDNAVKLWGKLWDSEEQNLQAWQYYSQVLLDLYQQSGLIAVEKYLMENL